MVEKIISLIAENSFTDSMGHRVDFPTNIQSCIVKVTEPQSVFAARFNIAVAIHAVHAV